MRGYDELFYLLPQRRELSFAQLRSVRSTMKTLVGTALATLIFIAVALATDASFKTRLITSATLTIHVRDGVFLTIRNFTQDIDTGQRGVIVAGVFPPTPTPTPTPTATPTCTPTPCPSTPTPTPSPTPTPTPTPIFGTVLTASISGISSASSAEFVNEVVIAGPAVVTIDPVPGATLSVTYRKSLQPSQPTPTPTATPAPTPTPTATLSASTTSSSGTTSSHSAIVIESSVSDDDDTFSTPTPTATPTSAPSSQLPTPTPTPSITPTPLPTPK